MKKRVSSQERLQRMALEAELTAKEKAEEKGKKKKVKKKTGKTAKKSTTTRARKTVASSPRMKMAWKVFNAQGKEVAAFPYPKKDEADAKAVALTARSKKEHRVRPVKVPIDEAI